MITSLFVNFVTNLAGANRSKISTTALSQYEYISVCKLPIKPPIAGAK